MHRVIRPCRDDSPFEARSVVFAVSVHREMIDSGYCGVVGWCRNHDLMMSGERTGNVGHVKRMVPGRDWVIEQDFHPRGRGRYAEYGSLTQTP